MVTITDVRRRSSAAQGGILPGDILISINSNEIHDVLDYRFYLAEESVELLLSRDDKTFSVCIKKDIYDDIGLDFETPLMDKKQHCSNKCIFCFIDQLPKGLRPSLYFKDDDARLSFLHGNYITLTNLKESDIERIIKMRISPVNISVHTTNPELRVEMMKNKHAGEVLRYIGMLAEAEIELHCQIVLCRGINDGEELSRTMTDLAAYYPAMQSVSVVPAGLTAYRDGLHPLTPFTAEECASVIDQVTVFGDMMMEKYGQRLFFCSDEFYLTCGRERPDEAFYEGYLQIENGVGMLTSFETEVDMELEMLTEEDKQTKRTISIATGEAAYDFIRSQVAKITDLCYNLTCHVYKIKNEFFGGSVTVTGLITGRDLLKQLEGADLGSELLLSRSMLRSEGDLFLCSTSTDEISETLGVPLNIVENDGCSFVRAVLGGLA